MDLVLLILLQTAPNVLMMMMTDRRRLSVHFQCALIDVAGAVAAPQDSHHSIENSIVTGGLEGRQENVKGTRKQLRMKQKTLIFKH